MMKTQAKLILMLYLFVEITSKVEFTNIKCDCPDKKFCDVEYCYLKSVNRSYKYMSVKVHMKKLPLPKFWVNLSVFQKLNGYKPFLYNVTVDGCKFLKYPKSNPIVGYFYDLITSHSNLNHTCPFNNDLFLEKLSVDFVNNKLTAVLPVPEGDYLLHSQFFTDNRIKKVEFKFYASLT